MDHLAGSLCDQGKLGIYVRRYTNKGRKWERALGSLSKSSSFLSLLQKRALTPGLLPDKVVEAGILYDVAAAVASRLGKGQLGVRAYWELMRGRNCAIASKGAILLGRSKVVVGNYGVSQRAFEAVKSNGGRTILNYPNAHHEFSRKLLAEEAQLEPSFASTITDELADRSAIYERECELADTILVGSSFVERTFAQEGLGAKEIIVVPYGSDVSKFTPRTEPRLGPGLKLMFAGQLTQRKGISYLLKAYMRFRGPGTELSIAGRFVSHSNVFDSYQSSVRFLGALSHPQLAEEYRRADVFVFPTLLEGLPLVVLEAMASGLPVITTANGPGDIVRDGIDGFVVSIRDPDAIVERLEYLRANPELRVEMGRNARSRALDYTWQRYSQSASSVVLNQFVRGA